MSVQLFTSSRRSTLTSHIQVLEIEKQRNINKVQHETSTTINNAPGWNEYLASSSEASVKVRTHTTSLPTFTHSCLQADRSDHSIHDLQSQTVEHVHKRHHGKGSEPTTKGAVSGEERVGAYEATYERDETTGPLKHSAPKEQKERNAYKQKVGQKEADLPGGV